MATYLAYNGQTSLFAPANSNPESTPVGGLSAGGSKHLWRGALDVGLERRGAVIVHGDCLDETLCYEVSAFRTGMCMVFGVECISLCVAELSVHVDGGLEVVDEAGALADVLGGAGGVGNETRRRAAESAALPRIVGRLTADDNAGALGDETPRRRLDVVVKRVDGLARLA